MKQTFVHSESRHQKTESRTRKPTSDEKPPLLTNEEWERDGRVKLPNDALVKSTALTHAEFLAATGRGRTCE